MILQFLKKSVAITSLNKAGENVCVCTEYKTRQQNIWIGYLQYFVGNLNFVI